MINKLIRDFKIETDVARKITFLISLLSLNENDVLDLYKKKKISGVSDDMILDWYEVNDIKEKIFYSFLEYKPSVSSDELIKKGFSGPKLGAEIKRLEIEKFKKVTNG